MPGVWIQRKDHDSRFTVSIHLDDDPLNLHSASMQARLKESWKIFLPKGYLPWSIRAEKNSPEETVIQIAAQNAVELKKVYFLYLEREDTAKIAAEKMKKALTAEIPHGNVLELMSQEKYLSLDSGIRQNSPVICLFEKSVEFVAEKIFSSGSFAEIEKNPLKKKEFWSALKSWAASL